MTISDKQSEKILNLIYDAAAEEELWRGVLTEIADLTKSQGGILFGQSLTASRIYFDFNGRLDEECNRAYQQRHMQNVWSQHMEHQPVGRVVFSDDAIELPALRTTAFFDEVLRPQDVAHNAMIALAAKQDFRAAFNICRTARQGPFGADEQKLFEWLVPHLRRSITLGFKLDSYRAMQRAAYDVLEQLSDGVMLLDRRAHLLFANAAARALETSRLSPGNVVSARWTVCGGLSFVVSGGPRNGIGRGSIARARPTPIERPSCWPDFRHLWPGMHARLDSRWKRSVV